MNNRRFRKYPQTMVLQCPCCQEIKYALCHFGSTGEAEYRCQCGHISKIKLAKLNMNREILDKTIEDFNPYKIQTFNQIYKEGFKEAIKWFMRLPLSERLTDDEAKIIQEFFVIAQNDKTSRSDEVSYGGMVLSDALIDIFGEELFNDKENDNE